MGLYLTQMAGFGGALEMDPYWPNVTGLWHFEDANGSTTAADSKGIRALTRINNSTVSNTVSKFGTGSGKAIATPDGFYAAHTGATDYVFGTGAFTVEFFVYPTTLSGLEFLFDLRPASTNGLYPTIYLNGTTLYYYTNSSDRISGGTLATSNWYHVALCRSGTTTKLFLGGTQVGSDYSDSNNYICGNDRPRFMTTGFGSNQTTPGYIDEIRITKGSARYTAAFTPPTTPFPNQ